MENNINTAFNIIDSGQSKLVVKFFYFIQIIGIFLLIFIFDYPLLALFLMGVLISYVHFIRKKKEIKVVGTLLFKEDKIIITYDSPFKNIIIEDILKIKLRIDGEKGQPYAIITKTVYNSKGIDNYLKIYTKSGIIEIELLFLKGDVKKIKKILKRW